MQTCGSVELATDISKEKRSVAAASEMRWKLHNNPYYYACVARAATQYRASGCDGRSVLAEKVVGPHMTDHPFRMNRDTVRHYCYHAQKEIEKFQCYAATKNVICKDVCKGTATTSRRSSKRNNHRAVRKNMDRFCQAVGLNTSMVDALQKELQNVWVQVQELEEACIWARMEINNLQLRVDSKGKSWTSKVYAKFAAKVLSSKEEAAAAAGEERSQQELQLHIKKLEKQLTESKTALIKAKKDIHHERKAKELLQLACAELSHEIGQGKLEIDELKEDSMQVITHQGEGGRKREAWSQDKVLVKLTQAKFEVAHKNIGNIDAVENQMKYLLAAALRRR